jgi:hypothetical protein
LIEQFICETRGRHWYGGVRPRPILAKSTPAIPTLPTTNHTDG